MLDKETKRRIMADMSTDFETKLGIMRMKLKEEDEKKFNEAWDKGELDELTDALCNLGRILRGGENAS